MVISKNVVTVMAILMALVGSTLVMGVPAYQDYVAIQALEENTEYQALVAIETLHPELYVVAVKETSNGVFAYIIVPRDEGSEEYTETVLVDIVTVLYAVFPNATTYHVLPVEISGAETFESTGHLGIANVGFGFTNAAAEIFTDKGHSVDLLDALYQAGEIGIYQPRQVGVHLIQETTSRPPGHIAPWAAVED